MKVIFFGTPQIAVPYLDWLIKHHDVVGVVTKQDEPVGRGMKITPPPVKVLAEKNNIKVFQPTGPWSDDLVQSLKELGADIGVAVAYGRFIPDSVIQAAKNHTINIHFSLLPQYRGAAPMQWSLINGDKETGVTAFWIVKEMDAGPIFLKKKIPVEDRDNAITMKEKLINLGLEILDEVMGEVQKGNLIKEEQGTKFTLAPQLKKEDGKIDWSKPAESIFNLVRGVVEWPGAFTHFPLKYYQAKKLKILDSVVDMKKNGNAGEILEVRKNEGVVVGTGQGALVLKKVQPEGKNAMPAVDFWRGSRLQVGDKFGGN